MMRSIAASILFAVVGINPALAQETVAPGEVQVTGALEIDLSENRFGEQVIIGADVFYGVSPDLDVGLVHSSTERTGFLADEDGGICIGDAFCGDTYDRPGVLGRYPLLRGESLKVLLEAGLIVVTFTDPFALSLKLGMRARWQSGKFFLRVTPNLFVGLAGRTIEEMGVESDFNKERLHVPVDVGYGVAENIDVFVQLGVAGPLADFVDGLNTPLGAGLSYRVTESIAILGWFSFLNVFNTQPDFEIGLDIRAAGVSATIGF